MSDFAYTREEVARRMDQAVLRPELTDADLRSTAAMCRALGIGNLCVRPTDAALAKSLLAGSGTTLSVVVGFPHGASRREVKALEARLAIADGADELDMVMNLGKFHSGENAAVQSDIEAVVAEAKPKGVLVKVILETAQLNESEIVHACDIAIAAGADFVKTSTGFNGPGATPEAVKTMIRACSGRARVKASGGIRDWLAAVTYLGLGADRLGLSAADVVLAGAPSADEQPVAEGASA